MTNIVSYENGGYLWVFLYHLFRFSSPAIELVGLYNQNQPDVGKFNFWLSRAQLESPSELQLVIMFIVLNDP